MNEKTTYNVIQIEEAAWRIEDSGVYAFLFVGREKALLVDTGRGSGNIREEVDRLTQLPVLLVNTHADRDHVGCNEQFDQALMHPAEYDRYRQNIGPGRPVSPLWEGDVLDLGGRRFQVVLTPGHTPGSIALLDEENRLLVGGDGVQTGTIYMFGPGRHVEAYIESLKKLRDMRGRFDTVYPSHGPFPVEAAIIDELIVGAQRLRRGELTGAEAPFDPPVLRYDAGVAGFYYAKEG